MNQEHLDENLIGYLLGALDDNSRFAVEAQIQRDPELRFRLEQLQLAMEPLAADKVEITPPKDLAVRTIARVAEYCCLNLSRAPVAMARSTPQRSWWRRADLIVAAALFLMALGLILPALLRLRDPSFGPAMVQCQDNLRVFSSALQTYKDLHHQFPSVVVEKPRDVAGMVVPILANAGVLQEPASVRCPGSGPEVPCPMTLEQGAGPSPVQFTLQAGNLVPSYAYSLGHKDAEGNYYGPAVPEGFQACDFPLLADGPPADGGLGNSNNHGGKGQNVLFADGNVRFVNLRTIGFQNDDIFLNKANQVAAGLDPCDPVLGASAAKP